MFVRILLPQEEKTYALLRIVAGLLFTTHGLQKIFGILSDHPHPPVGSQIWFGGIIELLTGLAITAGLFTTCSAFVASGTMAVAYIQFHWKLQFDAMFFPAVNNGEPALLNAFLFLFIACRGAGIWSLDKLRRENSPVREKPNT